MRLLKGSLLLATGVLFALLSFGALRNLWADYRDSPSWVYILYGSVESLVSVLCLVLAVRSLRQR